MSDEKICTEHSGIVKTLENFTASITTLFTKVDVLSSKFEEKIVEFAQRPTWLVCTVMSVMSGTIGVLLTFILYQHFGTK